MSIREMRRKSMDRFSLEFICYWSLILCQNPGPNVDINSDSLNTSSDSGKRFRKRRFPKGLNGHLWPAPCPPWSPCAPLSPWLWFRPGDFQLCGSLLHLPAPRLRSLPHLCLHRSGWVSNSRVFGHEAEKTKCGEGKNSVEDPDENCSCWSGYDDC